MSAIPLTVFLSIALAGLFTLLFWREQRRNDLGGPERESLLPLADETPRPAGDSAIEPPGPGATADRLRAAAPERCGCRAALRSSCAGCLRHAASLR